ncbi:MAG TPA: choice-of-anchor V domain-containing protein [Rubricoccaceae bacterium]|jgi:hypothetical protein
MIRLPLRALASTSAAVVVLAAAAVLGAPRPAATYPSGSPGGFDGSLLEPSGIVQTCSTSGCHDSYALNSGTGSVSVSVPSAVQPGQTVPVTVTVVNTTTPAPGSATGRRQGFEIAARDASGAITGTSTVTDAANTRATFGADRTITHTTTGTTRSSWTFNWTAPNAPATVRFTAAGNAANGGDLNGSGGNSAGDYIYTTAQTVSVGGLAAGDAPEAAPRLALGAPHPNPVRTGVAALRLTLAEAADVRVRLVDGRGRTVRVVADERRAAGANTLLVRTDGLAPGLYFVVAEAGALRDVQPVSVAR